MSVAGSAGHFTLEGDPVMGDPDDIFDEELEELDDSVADPDFAVVGESTSDEPPPGPSRDADPPKVVQSKEQRKRGKARWGKSGGPGDVSNPMAEPKPDKPRRNPYKDTEKKVIPLPLKYEAEMEQLLDDEVFAYLVSLVPLNKSRNALTDLMHAAFGDYTSLGVDLYIAGKTKRRATKVEKNTPMLKPLVDKFIGYLQARFCGGEENWSKRLRDHWHETTRPQKILTHLSAFSISQSHRNMFSGQLKDESVLKGKKPVSYPRGYDFDKHLYQTDTVGDDEMCRFPLCPPGWKVTEKAKERQNRRIKLLKSMAPASTTEPSEDDPTEKKQRTSK